MKNKIKKYNIGAVDIRVKKNFKYIKNGSNKIMIIFQSAGRIPKVELGKKISKNKLAKYHSKLNYHRLSENKNYDYLYVIDNYNYSYGFYTIDHQNIVTNMIVIKINEYISNYDEVYTFGTSKGGSAAIIFGNLIKKCDYIYSGVPIINQELYIKKYLPMLEEEILTNKFTRYLLSNLTQDLLRNTKVNTIIFTGENDFQYEILKETHLPNNVKLYIDTTGKKHSEIIFDNLDFIYNCIFADDKKDIFRRKNSELKFPN